MGKKVLNNVQELLRRQRPTKKSKKKKFQRKYIFYLFGGLLGVFGLYLSSKILIKKVEGWVKTNHSAEELHVSVTSNLDLDPKDEAKIKTYLEQSRAQNHDVNLGFAARQLQKTLLAEAVRIIQTSKSRYSVHLNMPEYLFSLDAEAGLVLTKSGHIYANSNTENLNLPTLKNLLDKNSVSRQWNPDSSLRLSSEETQLITEILELNRNLQQMGFKFKSIEYLKFRGFPITSAENEMEVVIGRSPFSERLEQLTKILADLRKRRTQASRIELDYKGKMFIKEKTM